MPSSNTVREVKMSIRLSQSDHAAVERAATGKGLKASEWVRLVVLSRLSGEDEVVVNLIREVLAVRLLVLNTVLYLGVPDPGLTDKGLADLARRVGDLAAKQLEGLLSPTSTSGRRSPRHTHGVSTRFTEPQFYQISLAAQAQETTPADWTRQVIQTTLRRDLFGSVLAAQIHTLRSILDEVLAPLSRGGRLDRQLLTSIKQRTDPVPPPATKEQENTHA